MLVVFWWPSHSAMTEMSTPACSSCIAAVCRIVCIVTCLLLREAQTFVAVSRYLASRCSNASRERWAPVGPGNSAVPARVARSVR